MIRINNQGLLIKEKTLDNQNKEKSLFKEKEKGLEVVGYNHTLKKNCHHILGIKIQLMNRKIQVRQPNFQMIKSQAIYLHKSNK